ncbi:DUF6090 family protein [Aegicerativicinus sediminis]
MTKFFRNLRRSFAMEHNTSKYLKYAIGEILLVVIGILIALQIDNWNENRKTTIQLDGYLNSIAKNIQSDTLQINQIKSLRIQQNLAALNYMDCVFKDSLSLELVGKIIPILGEQYLNINQAGYEALKNSGYIANLQGSAIEDALFNYYSYYEEIHESEISLNNFIENMEVGIYDSNYDELSLIFKIFSGQNGMNKFSDDEINKAIKQIFHNSKILGIMQRVASERYFEVYDNLKTKGEKVITLIKNDI